MKLGFMFIFLVLIISIISPLTQSMGDMFYKKIYSIMVYAPAVTSEESGVGVLSNVTLYIAYPGSGRVFFTANPLTELDTQATARIAAFVAASLAGVNYYDYDYYVIMESNTMIIGGPSAGALMTIGFLSLLLNKTIYPNITMTGMVYPDGMIGPVGGLKGKLEAVASAGFKVFLIPLGERVVTVPNVTVRRYPWGIYRSVTYYQLDLVEYGKSLGVQVIEVASIREAFKYFTGYDLSCKYTDVTYNLSKDIEDLFINHANELLDDARNNIESTQSLLNNLVPRYRSYVSNLISNVEDMISVAESYLNDGYVLLAVNNAFRADYMSIYTDWLANVLIDQNIINNYVDTVNNTLINVSKQIDNLLSKYYSSNKIDLSKLELLIAIDIRLLDAQYSFSNALNKINSDITSALSDLSYSYMRAKSAALWCELCNNVKSSIIINKSSIYPASITLYSIADNVLSYALALAQDLGTRPNLLDKAMEYMEKANSAYQENDTLAFIGELLYATSYSTLAIYRMFSLGSNINRELAHYLANESSYIMCCLEISSFIPIYYTNYGDEALDNNEYTDAYISYTMSILYSRFSWLVKQNTVLNMVLVQSNPYTPIRTPVTHSVNVLSPNNLQWLLIGIVIGLCIALIPLIIVYGRRRKVKPLVQKRIDISEEVHEFGALRKDLGEENQE